MSSIEDVSFDTNDFKAIKEIVGRLSASQDRMALEKQTQADIFEDASNAFEHKGLSKADIKKLIKTCHEQEKAQLKLDELDTLMDIAISVANC